MSGEGQIIFNARENPANRPRTSSWLTVASAVALAAGCDPIWENPVTVIVPVDVQGAFSPDDSGVVLVGSQLVARLCGSTGAPLTLRSKVEDVGCSSEWKVVASAVRLRADEIAMLAGTEKELVACGQTAPVDERRLGQSLGVFAVVKGWVGRQAVAAAEGLAFAGHRCASDDGAAIELALRLTGL